MPRQKIFTGNRQPEAKKGEQLRLEAQENCN